MRTLGGVVSVELRESAEEDGTTNEEHGQANLRDGAFLRSRQPSVHCDGWPGRH